MDKGLHLRFGLSVLLPLGLALGLSFTPESRADNSTSYGLGINGTQYLDSGRYYFRKDAANTNLSLIFKTAGDLKFSSGFGVNWDLDTEYSFVEKWNYFRPHELYGKFEGQDRRYWIGRKKFVYSQWEERWNQALFQPRFMDDKLHSTTAGLVGIFAEQNFSSLRLRGGLLPISIPEFGPVYRVADGEFVSKNPWFQAPPASFQYGGQPTTIEYSVDHPNDWSVIGKPGVVAQAEYQASDAVSTRTSYAYKPMPQILLGFPVVLLLPGTAYVQIKPRFPYHHVLNQDVVVKSGVAEYGVSAAFEHPVQDSLPDTWERQNVADATIASAYATTTVDEAKSWRITGSLLKVWGGDRPDSGPVQTTLTLFERRYQYTEAGSVEVRKEWTPRLSSGLRLVYDRLQDGLIYSGDVIAHISEPLSVRGSFDIFDLAHGNIPMPDGFMDVYRGNDRVFLGVNYAF
jgi:hypothetical protein